MVRSDLSMLGLGNQLGEVGLGLALSTNLLRGDKLAGQMHMEGYESGRIGRSRKGSQVVGPGGRTGPEQVFLEGTGRLKAHLGNCWRQLLPKKLPKSA